MYSDPSVSSSTKTKSVPLDPPPLLVGRQKEEHRLGRCSSRLKIVCRRRCYLLAHVRFEDALAKADALRRDLDQLVIADVLEGFLETHRAHGRQ